MIVLLLRGKGNTMSSVYSQDTIIQYSITNTLYLYIYIYIYISITTTTNKYVTA